MKRLQIFIICFTIALTIPLIFIVFKTYHGLEEEEKGALRYFSDRLFDNIENELATWIETEENRAVDEYNPEYFERWKHSNDPTPSPISQKPKALYIVGYLQNNPDGTFKTPLISEKRNISREHKVLYSNLERINRIFNQKKQSSPIEGQPHKSIVREKKKASPKTTGFFSEKYLKEPQPQKKRSYLGKKERRTEEITASQALNIARQSAVSKNQMATQELDMDTPLSMEMPLGDKLALSFGASEKPQNDPLDMLPAVTDIKFQVEVAPFQSLFIDSEHIFLFRRVMIGQKIYRQGIVIFVPSFLKHLDQTFFSSEPMSQFTRLRLISLENQASHTSEHEEKKVPFLIHRTFLPPFDFFSATLTCDNIPPSPHRQTLNIILGILAVVTIIGLLAIYQSARTVVDLSERRSRFVSSVTHELKTPLTNIRMYAEMLDEGIARKLDKEKEYASIINSESVRLTRLITNVLELSKLEKKKRHIHLKEGDFDDVIVSTRSIMAHVLRKNLFTMIVENRTKRLFFYDHELMVQVLINLIENSIKFGRSSDEKKIHLSIEQPDEYHTHIALSDFGPGIARHALKKVFNDFYREENELTRSTRGTGIGLSLVKRFVEAMGGSVSAANNKEKGCTISIVLKASKKSKTLEDNQVSARVGPWKKRA